MTEQEAWEASGIEGWGMTMIPRREVWRMAWAVARGETAEAMYVWNDEKAAWDPMRAEDAAQIAAELKARRLLD